MLNIEIGIRNKIKLRKSVIKSNMAKEIDFRKEYLPGYTGHVPKKMEVFG